MKTKLSLILLSFALSATVFLSCNNSESDSIEQSSTDSKSIEIRKKIEDSVAKRRKASDERESRNLESLASTPEGRKQMEDYLLIAKHSYVENNRLVLKLTLTKALDIGLDTSTYNRTIEDYAKTNHWIDSIEALPLPVNSAKSSNQVNNETVRHSFEAARNGTHKYYKYLNKHRQTPNIPPLRNR